MKKIVSLKTKLLPSIHIHWEHYKSLMNAKLKDVKDLVLAGDGRHDSMGHSAKYCAYTLFSCNDLHNQIVDFSLVQVCFLCNL